MEIKLATVKLIKNVQSSDDVYELNEFVDEVQSNVADETISNRMETVYGALFSEIFFALEDTANGGYQNTYESGDYFIIENYYYEFAFYEPNISGSSFTFSNVFTTNYTNNVVTSLFGNGEVDLDTLLTTNWDIDGATTLAPIASNQDLFLFLYTDLEYSSSGYLEEFTGTTSGWFSALDLPNSQTFNLQYTGLENVNLSVSFGVDANTQVDIYGGQLKSSYNFNFDFIGSNLLTTINAWGGLANYEQYILNGIEVTGLSLDVDTTLWSEIETAIQSENNTFILEGDYAHLINFNNTNDTVNASAHNDRLDGGGGNDVLRGNNGNDTLTGGDGNDRVFGDAGRDTIYLDNGRDIINGGSGRDKVAVSGNSNATVNLSKAGNQNTGFGTDKFVSIEDIDGGGGNDKLYGNNAANKIYGFGGADRLFGRNGNDTLSGGDGNDLLKGDSNNDKLYGGNGNDRLYLDAGRDLLNGGTGADYVYATGNVRTRIDLNSTQAQNTGYGNDRIMNIENIFGGSSHDTYFGSNGRNIIRGNNGNDTINGRNGNDLIFGGRNNDKLTGSNGNDTLKGDHGADRLFGGAGKDKLYAGVDSNRDVFVYTKATDSKKGSQRDLIYNFDSGEDDILLKGIDADTSTNGNQSFSFSEGAAANSVWTQTLGANNLLVRGDVNGDSVYDFEIQLIGITSLNENDFIL